MGVLQLQIEVSANERRRSGRKFIKYLLLTQLLTHRPYYCKILLVSEEYSCLVLAFGITNDRLFVGKKRNETLKIAPANFHR